MVNFMISRKAADKIFRKYGIKPALPDDPIYTRGFVIGGGPRRKSRKSTSESVPPSEESSSTKDLEEETVEHGRASRVDGGSDS